MDEIVKYDDLSDQMKDHYASEAAIVMALEEKTLESMIEVGNICIAVKQELGHGVFIQWVNKVLRMQPRTVQLRMQAAGWAGELDAVEYETFAQLPPTAFTALAAESTPEEARIEVRAALDEGRTLRQVDVQAISAAKKAPDPEAVKRAKDKAEAVTIKLTNLQELIGMLQSYLAEYQGQYEKALNLLEALGHNVGDARREVRGDEPELRVH